jgi:hypothetical protein
MILVKLQEREREREIRNSKYAVDSIYGNKEKRSEY